MVFLVFKGFFYMLIFFCNLRGVLGSKVSEMNLIFILVFEKVVRFRYFIVCRGNG